MTLLTDDEESIIPLALTNDCKIQVEIIHPFAYPTSNNTAMKLL